MSQTIYQKMKQNHFPILVSLPRNEIELAEAARDAGADGVKVHLNAFHRASGTTFGGFQQERPFLEALSRVDLPRAIMIGQEKLPSENELRELEKLGFESYNLYLRHVQPHLFKSSLRPFLALDHGYKDEEIARIREVSHAVIEASVMSHAEYGTALSAEDLAHYKHIVRESQMPVVVPSQKKITADDLPSLRAAGVHALLLGVIVTGDTADSIRKTVRTFVEARDRG